MGLIEGTNNNTVKVDPPKPVEIKANNIETDIKKTENNAQTIATTTNLNDREFAGNVVKDQLATQYNTNTNNQAFLPIIANGANTQSVDPDKVDAAVDSIKDKLSQSLTDWDVSKSDLNNIQNEFRNLNDEEANAVFDRLSDNDLNRWTDELNGTVGGFNTGEKKELFDQLSGQLNSGNAVRFLNSLDRQEDQQAFANSYAANAPDSQVERIINGTLPNVATNEDSAVIVAELISGLEGNPQAIERALGNMSQTQINAVLDAAAQSEIHSTSSPRGGGSVHTTFDPEPLAAILDAVATSNNPELKANFFEAAANQLSRIEDAGGLLNPVAGRNDAMGVVRDGMTRLLQSDTNGIMTQLETNFRSGNGISTYAKSMLKAGETEELGNIIARLSKGNDLTGDPFARFGTQVKGDDNNQHYRTAQVLGYFAGGLFSGAKQITNDRTEQAAMFSNVFGTIAGATGAINVPAGVASSIVNGLTNEIVGDITTSLNNGTMELEEALNNLIFPRNADGKLYEGDAENAFDSAFGRVVDRNG